MGADDFILGNTDKDFKNLKAYQDAIQARDWQMCEHISNNQELYFLKEDIEKLKAQVAKTKRDYELLYNQMCK